MEAITHFLHSVVFVCLAIELVLAGILRLRRKSRYGDRRKSVSERVALRPSFKTHVDGREAIFVSRTHLDNLRRESDGYLEATSKSVK